MSDTLKNPMANEATGDLNDYGFMGSEALAEVDLDSILADLKEQTAVPWDKVPVETPDESHRIPSKTDAPNSWFVTHREDILSEKAIKESDREKAHTTTPAKQYREQLASSMERLGFPKEAATSMARVAAEMIANARFHSSIPDKKDAAECRMKLYHEIPVGGAAVRSIVIFESENHKPITDETPSSGQEQSRGSGEGGRGFGVIRDMTEEFGGRFGRYIRERTSGRPEAEADMSNRDPKAQRCAVWVTWASMSATLSESALREVIGTLQNED